MIITKLEQRDIPGCREIYNYYVKNTSFSLEETEQTADQYEARVAGVTERFPFLVARDDAGNVAGFLPVSREERLCEGGTPARYCGQVWPAVWGVLLPQGAGIKLFARPGGM